MWFVMIWISCVYEKQNVLSKLLQISVTISQIFLQDENLPDPGMGRILKLNASEWPYITLGCICAAVTGIIQPLFAVIFAEILGVSYHLFLNTYI